MGMTAAPPAPRARGAAAAALWQLGVVAAAAALVLLLARNAAQNMASRNITFGFDFLSHPAGFDIPFHLLGWQLTDSYGWALVVCAVNSLLAAVMSIALASALGLLLALMRLSGNPLAGGTARGIVELVRNTPQLLQIIFVYYVFLAALPPPRQSLVLGVGFFLNVRGLLIPTPALPGLMWLGGAVLVLLSVLGRMARRAERPAGAWLAPGLLLVWLAAGLALAEWDVPRLQGFNFTGGMRLPPELIALWLGISVYTSAFISESIRAAILAIPHGQTEAAYSIGLSRGRTMSLVILPQALRLLVPPLTSQYLNIIKSTTLGAAIGYPDVLQIFGRTVLNQSGRAVEVMALIMALFLAINLPTSALMNAWNRRLMQQGR